MISECEKFLKEGTNTVHVKVRRGTRPDIFDISTWLIATFGYSSPDTWIRYLGETDYDTGSDWWCYDFKNPKHATMFRLVWA